MDKEKTKQTNIIAIQAKNNLSLLNTFFLRVLSEISEFFLNLAFARKNKGQIGYRQSSSLTKNKSSNYNHQITVLIIAILAKLSNLFVFCLNTHGVIQHGNCSKLHTK